MKSEQDNQSPWNRETILFTVGLLLTVGTTVVDLLGIGSAEPSLLILFAGMMGLPTAIRYDDRRRARKDEQD